MHACIQASPCFVKSVAIVSSIRTYLALHRRTVTRPYRLLSEVHILGRYRCQFRSWKSSDVFVMVIINCSVLSGPFVLIERVFIIFGSLLVPASLTVSTVFVFILATIIQIQHLVDTVYSVLYFSTYDWNLIFQTLLPDRYDIPCKGQRAVRWIQNWHHNLTTGPLGRNWWLDCRNGDHVVWYDWLWHATHVLILFLFIRLISCCKISL